MDDSDRTLILFIAGMAILTGLTMWATYEPPRGRTWTDAARWEK